MFRKPTMLSQKGARFIARFEGFVSRPYNDPGGNATIGYGHLLHHGPVTQHDRDHWGIITTDQGLGLLWHDAEAAAKCVLASVDPPFRLQTRFDAICSF